MCQNGDRHRDMGSSSFRSSDGHSSLCDESSSTLQVLQTAVELPGHWGGVGPGPLSERLVKWAGLQQMFCCLVASLAGVLLCVADVEFCVYIYDGSGGCDLS